MLRFHSAIHQFLPVLIISQLYSKRLKKVDSERQTLQVVDDVQSA